MSESENQTSQNVVLIGDGYPAKIWKSHLTTAGIEFVHLEERRESRAFPTDAEIYIETLSSDYRFMDGDPSLDIPEDMAKGFFLTPCYNDSPTEAATHYSDGSDRIVGYTLFDPPNEAASASPIIEIARAIQTSDESWEYAQEFLRKAGLRPEIAGDSPGLIFGRTIACLINEAASALSEGIASAEDIDRAMQLGVNYPRGLFEWADSLGIELISDILNGLNFHYQEERYRTHPLIRHLAMTDGTFLK